MADDWLMAVVLRTWMQHSVTISFVALGDF